MTVTRTDSSGKTVTEKKRRVYHRYSGTLIEIHIPDHHADFSVRSGREADGNYMHNLAWISERYRLDVAAGPQSTLQRNAAELTNRLHVYLKTLNESKSYECSPQLNLQDGTLYISLPGLDLCPMRRFYRFRRITKAFLNSRAESLRDIVTILEASQRLFKL